MAGALLIALPAPALARAPNGPPKVPEQVVAIQFRGGTTALAGEGAGDVDQPPLSHVSGALLVRAIEGWYLDFTVFGERTLDAEAGPGKVLLGIEGATAGVRARPAFFGESRTRLVAGAGAGGGRVFVPQVKSFTASEVYVLGGVERELGGDDFNAGAVGLEAMWQQYFTGDESPFRGGGFTVRLTFSYYMGGSYLDDCL